MGSFLLLRGFFFIIFYFSLAILVAFVTDKKCIVHKGIEHGRSGRLSKGVQEEIIITRIELDHNIPFKGEKGEKNVHKLLASVEKIIVCVYCVCPTRNDDTFLMYT